MLNHRRPKQTAWSYSDERKGFIIESLEDVERGGHVYDSYGKKCNSRFLLNYGFIVLDNDGNEVALKVNYKSDDPCIKTKTTLLKENPQTKTFRVMASIEEENTVEFLNFLRFVNIRDNQTVLEVLVTYIALLQGPYVLINGRVFTKTLDRLRKIKRKGTNHRKLLH
jgi:histone-lysine N-methyltransferase SETD3